MTEYFGYEVVLLRHGETFGYDGDHGLTPLGQQQARERGAALAAELKPGTNFEPPHVAAHRVWRGIAEVGIDRPEQLVVLVATHSAPMRAFAATAIGADPGEPHNLADIRIHVGVNGTPGAATVTFREHTVHMHIPAQLPPWIDQTWFDTYGR